MKKIAVMSGKGGVGKSTVAANLSIGLRDKGFKVGLADLDITGSNIPIMMGIDELRVKTGNRLIEPAVSREIRVMAVSLVLKNNTSPLLMRGEKRGSFVRQIIEKVNWGKLDYLIMDMPPGSGDEAISILRDMKDGVDGVVIVTIPSDVSMADVLKTVNLCKKLKVKIYGFVFNMSEFECPRCKTVTHIFGDTTNCIPELAGLVKEDVIVRVPIYIGQGHSRPMIAKKVSDLVVKQRRMFGWL